MAILKHMRTIYILYVFVSFATYETTSFFLLCCCVRASSCCMQVLLTVCSLESIGATRFDELVVCHVYACRNFYKLQSRKKKKPNKTNYLIQFFFFVSCPHIIICKHVLKQTILWDCLAVQINTLLSKPQIWLNGND